MSRFARGLVAAMLLLVPVTAQSKPSETVVVTWNKTLLEAVGTRFAPMWTARALAVVHTCVYDAWWQPLVTPTGPQRFLAPHWGLIMPFALSSANELRPDGPATETPPGHWNLFAQAVSARDAHTVDDDVTMFFALGNALLDASIAV